ncbi:hypothetical protein M231_02254 [Tremella mesenterica]|uniref:Uncharacterized protein n=1 Tax=Tremella mesenterica TaxID=5217 RepID=A0A4Q1BR31_TREME|nr:uncharacterized protein TREMEDRAFT_65430 [Tremella mesenterica DSM 1558]EIW66561.1 hypothetical protein TREMEDRAFT_65430 [Tremella mesenterica DSM 1558]RXK40421.1 hypothetical protein M231_02254 [Tremella mesenterica]
MNTSPQFSTPLRPILLPPRPFLLSPSIEKTSKNLSLPLPSDPLSIPSQSLAPSPILTAQKPRAPARYLGLSIHPTPLTIQQFLGLQSPPTTPIRHQYTTISIHPDSLTPNTVRKYLGLNPLAQPGFLLPPPAHADWQVKRLRHGKRSIIILAMVIFVVMVCSFPYSYTPITEKSIDRTVWMRSEYVPKLRLHGLGKRDMSLKDVRLGDGKDTSIGIIRLDDGTVAKQVGKVEHVSKQAGKEYEVEKRYQESLKSSSLIARGEILLGDLREQVIRRSMGDGSKMVKEVQSGYVYKRDMDDMDVEKLRVRKEKSGMALAGVAQVVRGH